jgi:hypothetical protein
VNTDEFLLDRIQMRELPGAPTILNHNTPITWRMPLLSSAHPVTLKKLNIQ